MFDSLREKLGRFTEEVEEEAVETAVAEGDAAAEGEGEGGGEAEAEAEDDPEVEATGTQTSSTDAGPDGDVEAAAARAVETAVAEGDAAAAGDGEVGEEASAAETGFARRAKSLLTGRVVIDEEALEEPLWELEMALLESDVEMGVAEEVLEGVKRNLHGETRTMIERTSSVVEEALAEALLEVISVGQFDFEERLAACEKPVVIVFTGVNGVGKTTTIAKLSRYLEDRGYSSVLANGDTYRAGANEQLAEHAERLGRKLIAHESGGDPAAVIYDAVEYAKANDVDVVLGDTAGRLHTHQGLMDQLAKIDRVVDPDLVLFVDEAVAGQDAVRRAREFDEAAAFDGAVLTKADADANGGAAISIAHVTGKPILFLGTGQGYEDLEPFDPETMVERLLGGA